jgi:uncharacterized membrane protein YeaQ/YmgE (transglycosylase-associated protein family)
MHRLCQVAGLRRARSLSLTGESAGTEAAHLYEQEVGVGIIGWIILGLLAGALAKLILPGDQPGGFIVTTIVGVIGAVVAGFIAQAVGFGDPIDEFFDISTWIAAIIGAIVLLLIWQWVAGRSGGRRSLA